MNEKVITPAQKSALKSAEKEAKITPDQFISEIYILLEDYFLADFEKDGNAVECRMKNGQKFVLTATEA